MLCNSDIVCVLLESESEFYCGCLFLLSVYVIPAAMHGGFFVIFLITSVLTYLICMLHSKIIEGLRERTEYIDIFLFFPPITQLCSVSDVLFTGGRGVSDFSLLK